MKIFLFFLMFILFLSGCAPSQGPEFQTVTDAIRPTDMVQAISETVTEHYQVKESSIETWVLFLPSDPDTNASEILLARAASPFSVADIATAVARRNQDKYAEWEHKDPNELKKVLSYQIIIQEPYILYAVTDDSKKITSDFLQLFQ